MKNPRVNDPSVDCFKKTKTRKPNFRTVPVAYLNRLAIYSDTRARKLKTNISELRN